MDDLARKCRVQMCMNVLFADYKITFNVTDSLPSQLLGLKEIT